MRSEIEYVKDYCDGLALVNVTCENRGVEEIESGPPMNLWLMQPWMQKVRSGQMQGSVERALEAFGQPPELLVQAVKAISDDPGNRMYLKERGRALARFAVSKIPGVREPPKGTPSPPNAWVKGVVSPVLDPLTEGFSEEAAIRLKPLVAKAAGVLVGVGLLGFILGRITKR